MGSRCKLSDYYKPNSVPFKKANGPNLTKSQNKMTTKARDQDQDPTIDLQQGQEIKLTSKKMLSLTQIFILTKRRPVLRQMFSHSQG